MPLRLARMDARGTRRGPDHDRRRCQRAPAPPDQGQAGAGVVCGVLAMASIRPACGVDPERTSRGGRKSMEISAMSRGVHAETQGFAIFAETFENENAPRFDFAGRSDRFISVGCVQRARI